MFLVSVLIFGEMIISLVFFVWVIGNVFYIKLDIKFGIVMMFIMGVMVYFV